MFNSKRVLLLFALFHSALYFKVAAQGRVNTEYDNATGKGTIAVTLEEGEGPFRYLISKGQIPTMEELFSQLDKTLQLTEQRVTPQTFLPADIKSNSYTFNDLDAGTYYIKVWDASNRVLLNNVKANVSAMLKLAKSTNITLQQNQVSATASERWGGAITMIEGGFQATEKDQQWFHLQIGESIPHCFIAAQPATRKEITSQPSAITVGVLFEEGKIHVMANGKSQFSNRARENEEFSWGFDKGNVILKQGEEVLFNKALKRLLPESKPSTVYNLAVNFASKGSIGFTPMQPVNTNPITPQITHGNCNGNVTSVNIVQNTVSHISNLKYKLYNSSGGIVGQSSGSTSNQVFNNLTPGDYRLDYSYTANWFWGTQQVNTSKTLTVGVYPKWNALVGPVTTSGNAVTCTSSSFSMHAKADARNYLPQYHEGWIDFKTLYAAQSSISAWILGGKQGNPSAINNANYPVRMYKNSLFTLVEDHDGNPGTYFKTINNKFRLKRTAAGEVSLYSGTSTTPVFTKSGYSTDFYLGIGMNSKNDGFFNVLTSYGCTGQKTFVRPRKKLDGGYYSTQQGKLYVQYKEEYNTSNLSFKVYNELNQEQTISIAPVHFRGYGENGIEFDFSTLPSGNKYYVLEITNPKNEKWYLRFMN